MSARIEEILEVIDYMHSQYSPDFSENNFRSLRRDAVDYVASCRGIDSTTVSNKFRRELIPDITGTADFDSSLRAWLDNRDSRLKHALIKHSKNDEDESSVNRLFSARETVSYSTHGA